MGLWVLTPMPGVLKFVLLGWNMPEGGMQPPPVADPVDEVRQPLEYVFHRFVFVSVHLFVLEGLEVCADYVRPRASLPFKIAGIIAGLGPVADAEEALDGMPAQDILLLEQVSPRGGTLMNGTIRGPGTYAVRPLPAAMLTIIAMSDVRPAATGSTSPAHSR